MHIFFNNIKTWRLGWKGYGVIFFNPSSTFFSPHEIQIQVADCRQLLHEIWFGTTCNLDTANEYSTSSSTVTENIKLGKAT